MKSSCKSLDVFEFTEEDELPEIATKRMAAKFKNPHALDHKYSFLDKVTKENESSFKEIASVICGSIAAADFDYNCDTAGSFDPMETEEIVNQKTSDLNHDPNNILKVHAAAAEITPNNFEPGSSSSPGASACVEDQSNFAFREISFNELDSMASDETKTSSGGPSSNNCFNGWDLGDNSGGILFYPDYLDYRGSKYLDSLVNFSRSCIEVQSKIHGAGRTFHIQMEIENIVKIESWCSDRYKAGSINIYFISKDVADDEIAPDTQVSAIQELKFQAVDSNWCEKLETIESLDVRYKAIWNVLIDGTENHSAFPDWKSMMRPRKYFPNFDKPFEEVIFPKGDPDAVAISKRDVDLLQPDTFVNDTIIDFYIKYLKNQQNVEERSKFHFFNSFFFRKLADMDKDPSSAFDGKAAFQRVRKWTRKVNLLEKDFIFIPVNYNYHWSLIVICYFGEVGSYKDIDGDESTRVPCVLHMDSIKGSHAGLKDLMQSYLWEEWKVRQKDTCEDLCSRFRNLKFVSLELPQQQNSYDCGLFLLHYVELFLEDVPANFNIDKITSSSTFLQSNWFPPDEASMKRPHIERLIYELLETRAEASLSSESDTCRSPIGPNTTNGYGNHVELPEASGLLGHGIEMTLLPNSCTESIKNPGSSLKELFEPEPANDTSRDFEHGVPLDEGNSFLIENEVEANGQFEQPELPEPPLVPYQCGDFLINPSTESSPNCDVSEVEEAVNLADDLEDPICMLSGNIESQIREGKNDFSYSLPESHQANQVQETRHDSHEEPAAKRMRIEQGDDKMDCDLSKEVQN